jgi:hypothetical protein
VNGSIGGGVGCIEVWGGGGGDGFGMGCWVYLFGWSTGAVWVGVGSPEVRRCVGPCAGEWVNR